MGDTTGKGVTLCRAKQTEKYAALVSFGQVIVNRCLIKKEIRKLTSMTQAQSVTNKAIVLQMKTEIVACAVADIPSGQKFYKKKESI